MKRLFHHDNISFAGIQWFIWSAYGIYYGFLVPYLKAAGYDEVAIGILMSVQNLMGSVAPVLWGAVTDRLKSPKGILAFNIFFGCAAALLIPAAIHSFAALIAIFVAISLTTTSVSTVLDGWAMRLKDRGSRLNYGLVRGLGSISFAVTTVTVGAFFQHSGMSSLFILFFLAESVTAACIFTVRNRPDMPPVAAAEAQGGAADLSETPLWKNAHYIVFLILCTLLFVAEVAAQTFYPLLLQHAGGTTSDLGLGLCVQALSEAPVMFLSGRLLRKFKDTTLLAAAMGFFVIRFSLFYVICTVPGLIAAQLSESLSFGLFLPVSVHYLSRITPVRLKATAITLAVSVYYGVGGFAGGILGGAAIERFGIGKMYLGIAVLTLAVTALFAGAQTALKKRDARACSQPC